MGFSTDAPLPTAEEGGIMAPIPLFDRLRVEVFESGANAPCSTCTRDFDASHEAFEAGEVSFGVAAPPGTDGIRIRARLFWSKALLEAGSPLAGSTIDVLANVPPIPEDSVEDATIFLRLEDVGKPVALDGPATVKAESGPPHPGVTGTHPLVRRVPCQGTPLPDEVCVPGGAFWMRRPFGTLADPGLPEHQLVVLSPFFIQHTEMTVGEARGYTLADEAFGAWSGDALGIDSHDFCSYDESGNRDSLPMNCLSYAGAADACAKRGATLPTSAQLEYLSGGLRNQIYPWGSELPSCADAVWGRDWVGGAPCLFDGIGGPLFAGSGLRDRLFVPPSDLPIVDLVGNVTEYVQDAYRPASAGGCWGARFGETIAVDPVCEEGDVGFHLVHGASWLFEDPTHLSAWVRHSIDDAVPLVDGGARCVRAATP